MKNFYKFLENIGELGNYTGDFVQARAALDKKEEGDASAQEIENWAKQGLNQVIDNLINVLTKNHRIEFFYAGIILSLEDVYADLRKINHQQKNQDANALWANSIRQDLQRISKAIYSRFSFARDKIRKINRFTESLEKQIYPLWLELNRILRSHISGGGTRELINKFTPNANERKISLLRYLNVLCDKEMKKSRMRHNPNELEGIYNYRRNRNFQSEIDDLHTLGFDEARYMVLLLLHHFSVIKYGQTDVSHDLELITKISKNPAALQVMSPEIKKVVQEILST